MARAKRTDRAEARRKYRAYVEAQAQAGMEEEEGSDGSAGSGRKPGRRTLQDTAPLQPGARMGIAQAARAAYRTPHYIDDVKSLRRLVFNSNAVWPILVIVIASVAYVTPRLSEYRSDSIQQTIFQFVFYPPLLPAMLAGFFAPRASWLAGLLASLIATIGLLFVLQAGGQTLLQVTGGDATPTPSQSSSASLVAAASTSPAPSPTAQITQRLMATVALSPSIGASAPATVAPTATSTPTASPAAPSTSPAASSAAAAASPSAGASASTTNSGGSTGALDLFSYAWLALLQSLTLGALIGGLSGWYKRFLALTSGPRKPPSKSGGSRPAQRRRPATARK